MKPFEAFGFLKHLERVDGGFSFQVYPFVFDPDPSNKPIITFEIIGAEVSFGEIQAFSGAEVEIEAVSDSLFLYSYPDRELEFHANNVAWNEAAYSIHDFAKWIVLLEAELQEAREEQRRLRQIRDKTAGEVAEMLRRSKIKSLRNKKLESEQAQIQKLLHRVLIYLEE